MQQVKENMDKLREIALLRDNGNINHDAEWKKKIRLAWKKKMEGGFVPWNKNKKRSKYEIDKIRETVKRKIKSGEIPNLAELSKQRSLCEKRRIYKKVSEKRKLFLRKHPSHQIIAWIFRNGGRGIKSSPNQEAIFKWARQKYPNETIVLNFPFTYNGRYAFGDVVFLERKLVIEYDGWEKDEAYRKERDARIYANGFSIERFRVVCFEEIERIISAYPLLGGEDSFD